VDRNYPDSLLGKIPGERTGAQSRVVPIHEKRTLSAGAEEDCIGATGEMGNGEGGQEDA
jgi:hypothetical protein